MKTCQTDNLFFGVLTGFMSSTIMLVTCMAIVQSALPTPSVKAPGPVVKAERVNAAAELPARQPVRL